MFDRGLVYSRSGRRAGFLPSVKRIDFVASDILRISLSASNGAAARAQTLMCVRYSPSVMWPLPICSAEALGDSLRQV